MSQQHLFRFVTDLLPDWRKTRRRVLALGVEGLLTRRRLTLTGIARGMESHCRIIHRVKRIWRFLNNPAVDPRQAVAALAKETFARRTESWVPIIFDESGLKDRAMLFGAGTWYRGRALPLALYAYRHAGIKKSLWAYREGLLSVIWQALSEPQRGRVLLQMAHQTHRLEELAADLNCGDCYFLEDVRYGPAKAKLNLLLWWRADQPEPWLIATTLPTAAQAKQYYRLRMGIEEMFKYLKGTFALESCQCQSTDRITRLALFALVSTWVLALLVRYPEQWVRFVTARGALSFLSLALEWLEAPPDVRQLVREEARSG